jgi:AcrR family transcriptional regulator
VVAVRARIVEVTADLLRFRDESEIRVTSIARTAGCATSVLYHHFGSREGVVEAAFEHLVHEETALRRADSTALVAIAASATDLDDAVSRLATRTPSSTVADPAALLRRVRGSAVTHAALAEELGAYEDVGTEQRREVARILVDRGLLDPGRAEEFVECLGVLDRAAPVTVQSARVFARGLAPHSAVA